VRRASRRGKASRPALAMELGGKRLFAGWAAGGGPSAGRGGVGFFYGLGL